MNRALPSHPGLTNPAFWLLAGLACAAGNALAAPAAWAVDGRCVAMVCVGDTMHSARRALDPALTLRASADGIEVRAGEQRWLQLTLEDGADPAAPTSRIAGIDVHRPGTHTGFGEARLGDASEPARQSAAGRWLPLRERFAGQPARWWSARLPSPPGTRGYPVNLAVDRQGLLAGLRLNGNNEREAAYPDLASALAASQARLRALAPTLAHLPQRAPTLHRRAEVFADLSLLADAASLRLTSRADCASASCEIMAIDIGSAADDDGTSEPLPLADGSAARLRPTACGGSCSPAVLNFRRAGLPLRISFETGFAAPAGAGLDAARDRRLLRELADSTAAR